MKIKNWDTFQHYKHRSPPWIKLHVKILNDIDFMSLPDSSKGLLVLLWILASENDGFLPDDNEELCFRLRRKSVDLNPLIDNGFLVVDSNAQADASNAQASADTEKSRVETEKRQTRTRKSKPFKPPEFDEFKEYCKSKGFEHIAEKAYSYYDAGGWVDVKGNKIKSWKQKLIGVWFDEEKNPPPKTPEDIYGGMEMSVEELMEVIDNAVANDAGLPEESDGQREAREAFDKFVGGRARKTVATDQNTIPNAG